VLQRTEMACISGYQNYLGYTKVDSEWVRAFLDNLNPAFNSIDAAEADYYDEKMLAVYFHLQTTPPRVFDIF
jgi:hypothetical protein